ncbi:hypothetical protein CEK25_004143 [Fusarium fujikuroi]|nr:hypothetical protein CEK25_004143 [Fusarium fujikuroi]
MTTPRMSSDRAIEDLGHEVGQTVYASNLHDEEVFTEAMTKMEFSDASNLHEKEAEYEASDQAEDEKDKWKKRPLQGRKEPQCDKVATRGRREPQLRR